MPLEFALRSRIKLDRPAPKRRPGWLRLPPLALPIGAYWLALAGVYCALRPPSTTDARSSREAVQPDTEPGEPPGSDIATAAALPIAALPIAPSLPTTSLSQLAVTPARSTAPELPQESEAEEANRAPEQREAREQPDSSDAREQPEHRSVEHRLLAHQRPASSQLHAPPPAARPEPPPSKRSFTAPIEARVDAPIEAIAGSFELPAPPSTSRVAVADREPPRDAPGPTSLPTCEAAAASASDSIDFGSARAGGAPDITRDAFAQVLENGAYLRGCAIPASAALEVCAAVQNGKVVGVSVVTQPRSATINACVRRAVAALRFPRNSRLDVTRTHFAPSP